MTGKSLSPNQNERLRDLLREIVDRDFAGNKTHAAKRLKLSQSMVSEVLFGRRGGGNKLLAALADYTGKSLDELSGRPPAKPAPEHTLELPLRYNAQAEAIRFAYANHPAPRVKAAVEEMLAEGHHGAEEWTPEDWYEDLKSKIRRAALRERDPATVQAERERGEQALQDVADRLRAKGEAAIKRGPRKREDR